MINIAEWKSGKLHFRNATEEEEKVISEERPAVPFQVTSGQAREALYYAGLLPRISLALDAIPDDDQRWRAKNAWEYRPNVERNSPFVEIMAQALDLDDAALDALFIDAASR